LTRSCDIRGIGHEPRPQSRRAGEQERRKEEQKIDELNKMIENWSHAATIREFMTDVKATIEERQGPINEGSDLATWMAWALAHADKLDPLEARTKTEPATASSEFSGPNQPR